MISETYRHLLRKHAKDDDAYQQLIELFEQQNKAAEQVTFLGAELQFLQFAPASIVITDATATDQPVIFVNKQFENETGYTFDEIKGKNLRLLQGDDRNQPEIQILRDALSNGESCQVVLRNYRKDGKMFWNELHISPIRDAEQNVRYFIGVQHDVTERVGLHENTIDHIKSQLRQKEAFYQQLVENSLDAISLHSPDGKYLYANQSKAELTGYSVDELLSLPVESLSSLVHPDDLKRTQDEAHRAVLEGQPATKIEYRLKHKDGHYIWAENYAAPLLNENGEVDQIISTSRDISAQKEAEEALRSSIERSNAIIAAIPDLMFRFDQKGKILDIEANSKDLYVPSSDAINRTLFEVLPHKVAEKALNSIQETLNTGKIQSFEYQLNIPAQGLRDYEARMVPSGKDEVIAIMRDVTDLKATQTAYERSKERSQKLLETIPDLIFLLNGDGVYLDYEADTSDLYYQSEGLIGKTVFETAPPAFAEQAMHYIREALATGEIQTFEYQLPMAERGMQDYEARIVPLNDNEVICYVRDITALKRSQQRELELILEKERRKLLTDFIRNAAHEFRTPLTSISTSAHIMVQSDDKERQREKALRIEQQVHRLTHLLDMLLLMMRLNNTEILPKTRINMQEFHETICEEVHRINKQRHQISCSIAPNMPVIMGNSELLHEAIMQIFDNAQRFTPDNGAITLTTQNNDGRLIIQVSDQGVGIDDDALQAIFQTFWRQDDVHTTPGFGLGLPIVQEIVKLHGGTIDIISEVNVGTTVTISLPVA